MRLLRQAGWIGALVVLAMTASWWVSRQFWLADSVNLFRPLVALLAAALLVLAFAARAPVLIAASVLLVGANAYLVVQPTLDLPTALASGARMTPVSIASFDVVSDASLPDFVEWSKDKKRRPDLVALQNLTAPWRDRITKLTDAYPFSASVLHKETGVKEDIVSRFPILDASVYRPTGGRTAVRATVLIEGEAVQVFVIDPNKATSQTRWAERNQYLGLVSQWAASQSVGLPAIMLGDWNVTPWSPFYADVFEQTSLKRADAGVLPPATHTLAHLPIPLLGLNDDHIAVSRHVPVEGCGPGPDLGSDHLPIVCQIHVR